MLSQLLNLKLSIFISKKKRFKSFEKPSPFLIEFLDYAGCRRADIKQSGAKSHALQKTDHRSNYNFRRNPDRKKSADLKNHFNIK